MNFPIWGTSSNLTVGAETEKSYILFKDQVQKKMDNFIYYFLLIMLSGAFISACLLRLPDAILIIRGISFIFIMLLFLFRKLFPKVCNVIFWTLFCIMDFIYSGNHFTLIQQNDKRGFFFAGYMLATIEIISLSSIAKHRQRLFIQIIFILNKVINFWEYSLENSRVFTYLGILTVLSLYFHFSQEVENKKNFKTIYESREKLKRFQSLITDDFPINVLIFPCNLKSIFYFNHCFTQNFFNPADFQRSEDALNYLFQDLLIESAKKDSKDNNLSISEYLQSFNDSTNQEVHTLLVTYQKVYKKSGYFELKLRRIIWEDQPAYTLILNDISDKYLIEGLKMADEQKDRVIATISHELRTPINGILGLLEMATSRTSDQACLNFLQHCKSCSKLLLYLVNSILDLSQIRHNSLKVHRTRFRLTKVLAEIASLYLFTAQQKNIELIIENQLEDPLLVVETDELKLIEILINLIGNAFKFTFSGHVKLHVRLDPDHHSKILFEIEDTGIGIKEQDKPKLFQMFGKLNHRDQNINTHGVGLGLTISNELVKALNGQDQGEKINFESVSNKGSKFWFRINALSRSSFSINLDQLNRGVLDHRYNQSVSFMRQGTLRTMSNTEITMTEEGPRKEKILIVDDNPFNLFTATFIVKKFGFEVDTAGSGQECLRLLDEESQKENSNNNGRVYRMILMDIQMPTMDGIETTQRIRERVLKKEMYEIPVVALTAKRIDHRERSLYQEKGLVAALEKPLVAKELAQILKQCL